MNTTKIDGRTSTAATIKPLSDLVSANAYLREVGRSRTWLWRMEKAGLLHPVNIMGKLYVSRADIASFEARAKSGELAKSNPYPRQQSAEREAA